MVTGVWRLPQPLAATSSPTAAISSPVVTTDLRSPSVPGGDHNSASIAAWQWPTQSQRWLRGRCPLQNTSACSPEPQAHRRPRTVSTAALRSPHPQPPHTPQPLTAVGYQSSALTSGQRRPPPPQPPPQGPPSPRPCGPVSPAATPTAGPSRHFRTHPPPSGAARLQAPPPPSPHLLSTCCRAASASR